MEILYSESNASQIKIDKGICRDNNLPFILWKKFTTVKHIFIDDENFANVSQFEIVGHNAIQSVKIGDNSFTKHKNGYGKDNNRSFQISDCTKLELIEIGQYSFSDYSGKFELRNNPSLKSIKIGVTHMESANFYYGSFVIRGIYIMKANTYKLDLPNLEVIELGSYSFGWFSIFDLESNIHFEFIC